MLSIGDTAPDFELLGNDNKKHRLSEFRGKSVVLYFYPKDNTPGCTREACSFRDSIAKLARKEAVVLGVSRDSIDSHSSFAKKYNLNFLLLSDPDAKVISKYDASKEGASGKPGTIRKTFVIGKDGKIAKIIEQVKPEEHAKIALECLNK